MISKKTLKLYGFTIALIVLTCILSEGMRRIGWLDTLECSYYDFWHQLAGKRSEPEHVVIISLDNQTLLKHRDEPMVFWGPHFAKAIDVLRKAGVSCIGIDFLFSVSVESWLKRLGSDISRTYDIPMREQLSAGNVVLIATIALNENGNTELLMPVNDYLFSLPGCMSDIALANLYLDNDGVIRRFMPSLFEAGQMPSVTFGMLMAKRASDFMGLNRVPDDLVLSKTPHNIGYLGPPGTVSRISFQKLLEPNAELSPELKGLKNKVVIISAEHAGTGNDIHLTPYVHRFMARWSGLMTGAEIQANIVETLLSGKIPRHVSDWTSVIFLIIAVSIGTLLFFRLSPFQGMGCAITIGLISSVSAYFLFLDNQVMPTSNIHLGLVISYIGSLGRRLSKEEQRRAWLQRVFGSYVSDAVVEKVLSSDQVPDLGGELLHVTVLFSDIRGFTTISEKLSPHEVVEMLNRYYSLACEPILNQGGMVDKFIGDAIMAIFGAPVSYEDQSRRALIAALEIADIAKNFQNWTKERFPDRDIPPFRIGVGIHTGEAVIGNIGSPKKMGYTCIGDTVNIASRLESMTKKLGWVIVASETTVKAAGPGVNIGRTEKVTPTGRVGHLEVMEVIGIVK